jgi:hypothetical protein
VHAPSSASSPAVVLRVGSQPAVTGAHDIGLSEVA